MIYPCRRLSVSIFVHESVCRWLLFNSLLFLPNDSPSNGEFLCPQCCALGSMHALHLESLLFPCHDLALHASGSPLVSVFLMSSHFPLSFYCTDSKLFIVGSSANGFGMEGSDMDLCLVIASPRVEVWLDIVNALKQLRTLLRGRSESHSYNFHSNCAVGIVGEKVKQCALQ